MRREQIKDDGPWALAMVRLSGGTYFIDLQLRQFRETMNPGSYVDFDSVKGRTMCRQAGVATCLACGFSVIMSPSVIEQGLRCCRCGRAIKGN